jgi:nicotinamidase/pyrazinamidase
MDPSEDCYSGFQAQGPAGEDLEHLLRQQGIKHIYVGGLATDYCVRATVLDALQRGFEVTVLEDAIRGVSDEGARIALDEMTRAGAKIVTLPALPILALKEKGREI